MTPEWLAALYCLVIALASLAGGWLPRWLNLTHSRMQVAISFVAGVVLGIGVLHLLPHGYYEWLDVDADRAIDRSVWWLLVGFLSTFFLQRLFHFHTHEAPGELVEGHGHTGECEHVHVGHAHTSHDQPRSLDGHVVTWGGVFFGLTIHSLVDGITLAAVIKTEWAHAEGAMLAGFGYFLAVVLHKPFDSLSITSLMIASGWSSGWRNAINIVYALVIPVGVALFFLGLEQAGAAADALLGGTLCFAAGACLCISSSDLLPELQFHSHDRLKLSAALVLGLALAWGLVYVENQGHDHHHHSSSATSRDGEHEADEHGGEAHHDHDHIDRTD
jgi:zinc and cadmium transporter